MNLKDMNVEWLRGQLGLVGQEPVLFDLSIADNIRLGLPNATQEDIESAAKQANAHDFIVAFPDGYETQVGIGGTQVSCSSSPSRIVSYLVHLTLRETLSNRFREARSSESQSHAPLLVSRG